MKSMRLHFAFCIYYFAFTIFRILAVSRPRWQLLLPLAIAILFPAVFSQADIIIDRVPTEVVHKTFDPLHPPASMPPLKENEAAITHSDFTCAVSMEYQVLNHRKHEGQVKADLQVQSVHATLRLRITIWLPKGASAKLSAHEEGHRQIDQRAYEDAEKIARTLAEKIDGRELEGEGDDLQAAEQAAVQPLEDGYCRDYLDQTGKLASKINDIYDDLTAHGTKLDPAEDEAIRQAFKKSNED